MTETAPGLWKGQAGRSSIIDSSLVVVFQFLIVTLG